MSLLFAPRDSTEGHISQSNVSGSFLVKVCSLNSGDSPVTSVERGPGQLVNIDSLGSGEEIVVSMVDSGLNGIYIIHKDEHLFLQIEKSSP